MIKWVQKIFTISIKTFKKEDSENSAFYFLKTAIKKFARRVKCVYWISYIDQVF